MKNGWIEIELIKKSQFTSEFYQGKGKLLTGEIVLFEGAPVLAGDRYFIKETNVITYE